VLAAVSATEMVSFLCLSNAATSPAIAFRFEGMICPAIVLEVMVRLVLLYLESVQMMKYFHSNTYDHFVLPPSLMNHSRYKSSSSSGSGVVLVWKRSMFSNYRRVNIYSKQSCKQYGFHGSHRSSHGHYC